MMDNYDTLVGKIIEAYLEANIDGFDSSPGNEYLFKLTYLENDERMIQLYSKKDFMN